MTEFLLYIDPGSGSYLVQVIVAAVLGIGFFFKNIGRFFSLVWWRIKRFFMRPDEKKS
jgi:hypothetical protein